MRILCLLAISCAVTCWTTSTSATPLDTFTEKQSSVSTGSTASTRIMGSSRSALWNARIFSARPGEICKQGAPSSYAVGTAGNGSVFFQSKNLRGGGEISWELNPVLRGRPIGEVRFELFDASPVSSLRPSSLPLTAFVRVEDKNGARYTINAKVDLRGSTRSRTIFFRLSDDLPQRVADSLKRPARITVGIRRTDLCDIFVGLRRVRFSGSPTPSPLDLFRIKSKRAATRQRAKRAGQVQAAAVKPQNSPSPVASPTSKTCATENQDVLTQKIQQCVDAVDAKSPPTTCRDVTCECIDHPGTDYTVEPVASNIQPKGTECTQTNEACAGDSGLCNEHGNCVPRALVDLTSGDLGFVDLPEDEPTKECIDIQTIETDPALVPEPDFLCTATVDEVKSIFKKLLKPAGTPCTGTDPDGTQFAGICSFFFCVRPPPPTDDCTGKAQCTDCDPEGFATNGACWNGSCLSMSRFEALNCQGFSNPCAECQGLAVCNPDGSSSRVERSRNEGGSCPLGNGLPGICRLGKCVSQLTVTPTRN